MWDILKLPGMLNWNFLNSIKSLPLLCLNNHIFTSPNSSSSSDSVISTPTLSKAPRRSFLSIVPSCTKKIQHCQQNLRTGAFQIIQNFLFGNIHNRFTFLIGRPCWCPSAWSSLCTSATAPRRSHRHRPCTTVILAIKSCPFFSPILVIFWSTSGELTCPCWIVMGCRRGLLAPLS